MNIVLKSLKLTNFKGARNVNIDFSEKVTNIYGGNRTGKTTVFDAFIWVLFGKDSSGRKDFGIKTIDENEKIIPKIEHEVEAVLDIGAYKVCLKSVYKEKWTTKRGSAEPVFTGHETVYFFNDVPMKQEEYRKKIAEISDEEIFKLITNPWYFNSLKWQDKRKILLAMVSEQTDYELADSYADFKVLAKMFESKTAEEVKKEITAKKKKIKTQLTAILTRIDEVTKGKPEAENWEGIKEKIAQKKLIISGLQKRINEANIPSKRNLKLKNEINILKTKIIEFENNIKNSYNNEINIISQDVNKLKNELSELSININSCNRKILSVKKEIKESNDHIEKLRGKIKSLNDKIFDENSTICPTCGRVFESDKIADMKNRFEESKIAEFKGINKRGKNLKKGVAGLQNILSKTENDKVDLEKKAADLEVLLRKKQEKLKSIKIPDLSEYEEYTDMCKRVEELKLNVDKPADTNGLEAEKISAEYEIEKLNKILLKKEQITAAENRIKELENEHKFLAQKAAELDEIDFKMQAFMKVKIENLENRINSKFQLVKFKLFETQINGAEIDCCDTTFKGVSFHDINNEMKLNAGLDIINGLCKNYNIYAPIFIDNRESVTNIIDTESQVINLIVNSDDEKIRVEGV